MIKRTWPYGTKKRVEVIHVEPKVLGLVDQQREGYLLALHGLDPLPVKGDQGIITFTQGGPTGGYWKYEPINQTN